MFTYICRKSPLQGYELFINLKKEEYFSKYGKKCPELLYVRDRCIFFLSEHISNTGTYTY